MLYDLLTPSNILSILSILGIIFAVYIYFRKPQEDLDKRQAVSEKEVDGKAEILRQQVQWEKEATEKRFAEIANRLDTSMSLAQNHIHTVDVKCDKTIEAVNLLTIQITKLSTILEERLPKK